jgi:6-phosphogluconate dehydrogenase
MQPVYFIMGVAGSGKSTIGQLLAKHLQRPFYDGDDFHSEANRSKMAAGIPLTDADRHKWLEAIHSTAVKAAGKDGAVIACSALKKGYRNILQQGLPQAKWIYLKGSYDTILQRLQQRRHHFMPASLLQSQFDILEEPHEALQVNIESSTAIIIEKILQHMQVNSALGIIGMGVMGKSLARNAAAKGIRLSVFNRHVPGKEEKVAEQLVATHTEMKDTKAFEDLKAFVQSLDVPRKILLMVNAGAATDIVMEDLVPLLSNDDMVIDGGNAHFKDTEKRMHRMKEAGLHWLGCGISGGEEGALKGPAMMAGGERTAYEHIRPLLEMLAAKDFRGNACCTYAGPGGAGHFVKMVHNGIEYAEMQLLAEVYHIMRQGLKMIPDAIANELEEWQKGDLHSYLLGITVDILRKKEGDEFLIDKIADAAASKGTGSWATQTAAELGVPASLLTQALFARFLSADIATRQSLSNAFSFHKQHDWQLKLLTLKEAYTLARIINHQQGLDMIAAASRQNNWNVDIAALAASWSNGCIIRSKLMETVALLQDQAASLLLQSNKQFSIENGRDALVETTCAAAKAGLAVPALSDALQFLHAMTTVDSPMNLIQAQRDYFGAHTYLRKDDPTGKAMHTNWQE